MPFHFRLDYGQREHSSYAGALLTFIAIASTIVFCFFKLRTWSQKPDIELMSVIENNAFDMTEQFGIKDGFFVAAALTGYDEATGFNDNIKYGQLEFSYRTWGVEALNFNKD